MEEKQSSDLKRAFAEDGALKTHVGGQALLEGIMMRGRYNWSAAVRLPDGGIYTEEHDLASGKEKHAWTRIPVIRGCVAFFESLVLGYKALDVAAEHAYDEDGYTFYNMHEKAADLEKARAKAEKKAARKGAPKGASDEPLRSEAPQPSLRGSSEHESSDGSAPDSPSPAGEDEKAKENSAMSSGLMTVSMILGLALGIALFIIIPAVLTNLMVGEYTFNLSQHQGLFK